MFSSPFKGEVRRGMGLDSAVYAHPHPDPPLEGEGDYRLGGRLVLIRFFLTSNSSVSCVLK